MTGLHKKYFECDMQYSNAGWPNRHSSANWILNLTGQKDYNSSFHSNAEQQSTPLCFLPDILYAFAPVSLTEQHSITGVLCCDIIDWKLFITQEPSLELISRRVFLNYNLNSTCHFYCTTSPFLPVLSLL